MKREGDRARRTVTQREPAGTQGRCREVSHTLLCNQKRLQLLLCTLFVCFVSHANCCCRCFCNAMPPSAYLHIIYFLEMQWHPLMQNNLFKCLSAGYAKTRFSLQAQRLVRNWADPLSEKKLAGFQSD